MGENFEKRLIDKVLPKNGKALSEELSASQIHDTRAFNRFLADAMAKSDMKQSEEKSKSDSFGWTLARDLRKKSLAQRFKELIDTA